MVKLRHIARFAYGDSLADAVRNDGNVAVYGSNGQVGTHSAANTLRPALIIGRKGSFGKVQYADAPVFAIDTTFYVDRRLTSADLRWLFYALQTLHLDDLSEDVGVPGLSRERAYDQTLPLPTRDEQRAIADYLDAETTHIDALIEKKQRMIGLLGERNSVLFTAALEARDFRWGASLESPAADGDVPQGWCVAHLTVMLDQLTNGYVGPTRDILVDDGVRYIQSLHIKDGKIDFARGHYYVALGWHKERPRIHLRAGDVLIVQTGDIGQVAVVPQDFGPASCHALQIARVRRNWLSGEYLGAYLRSPFGRQSLLSRVTGALHPHLEGGIRDIPIVVPPLPVQHELVNEVSESCEEADLIRAKLADQIALAVEHRHAIITAAVTGELDIAEAA